VAVISCLLAIWQFTGTDVLWRTVATCAVIATGMVAFFVVNAVFDWPGDGPPHVLRLTTRSRARRHTLQK
jgi:hypothetical protein